MMVDCASPCLSSSLKYNAFRRFENGTCELANVRNKPDDLRLHMYLQNLCKSDFWKKNCTPTYQRLVGLIPLASVSWLLVCLCCVPPVWRGGRSRRSRPTTCCARFDQDLIQGVRKPFVQNRIDLIPIFPFDLIDQTLARSYQDSCGITFFPFFMSFLENISILPDD